MKGKAAFRGSLTQSGIEINFLLMKFTFKQKSFSASFGGTFLCLDTMMIGRNLTLMKVKLVFMMILGVLLWRQFVHVFLYIYFCYVDSDDDVMGAVLETVEQKFMSLLHIF